jgi:dihydroorotate dehydrogenase
MLSALYAFARPALFALEPEVAHEATLKALESGIYPRGDCCNDTVLAQTVFGLTFPNPVGIAAGYDKDARVPDGVLGLGCGFAEIGTVTPKPQSGNPHPRVFRLIADHGLINRLGFNNGGHAAALDRLEARRHKGGIVGVNIGANKDSTDRSADYVKGIETFHHLASYFTVNISSPNTPGLRDLQAPEALDELLGRVMAARTAQEKKGGSRRPIIVKIAPDIAEDDIAPIVARLKASRFQTRRFPAPV